MTSDDIINLNNYFDIKPIYNYYDKGNGTYNVPYNGLYINYNLVYISNSLEKDKENKYILKQPDHDNTRTIDSLDIKGDVELNNRKKLIEIDFYDLRLFFKKNSYTYKLVLDIDDVKILLLKSTNDISKILLENIVIKGIIYNELFIMVKEEIIDINLINLIIDDEIDIISFNENLIKFNSIDEFIGKYNTLFYNLNKNHFLNKYLLFFCLNLIYI